MLIPDDGKDEEERYVLLTVQPRVAAGSLEFVELPAGMVDEEGEFVGTAAREIEEELGIRIEERELRNLSEMALGEEGGGGGWEGGCTLVRGRVMSLYLFLCMRGGCREIR